MSRQFIDCRAILSDEACSLAMSADSEDELLEAAVQHAVGVHGRDDSGDLRELVRAEITERESAGWGTRPIH